ncbi:glycoside hydrolase [Limnothrix sp. FACHB-881]|uniref:glycoside hydrolase n=1 Tax=Limnothrix sp. FACHB-881 TaxID=2692819 RepID=UPI001687432E|nr:glycoside hydrolase [Limnothrix sp. FACHB-881]MBD2633996.1 glycoside hydrolase [Limnothrix sp. FACHB-881]
MPYPLHVAFVWHQHQPLYKSRGNLAETALADVPQQSEEAQYRLPWVRLHGTKDYLDLILMLERFPRLRQTVNLVPSLMLQIEDYVAGRAIDPYLALALTPAEQLQPTQKRFVLEHFFDGNHRTLVDPHPRYCQLFEQRNDLGIPWCLDHWKPEDFGDLLAWHNLAWIDPLFWDDPEIARWLERGKDFSLTDRQEIWAKQREILARIIPKHRSMQESGQLEVTTTPYTHPILPLLADTDAGRVAIPQMQLPASRFQWAEDIPRHLERAKTMYQERFGCLPRGLWPSEQSVSPAMLPDVAAAGFQWLISDEAVLGWTIEHFFHRDGSGNVLEPQYLYQPYRLATNQGDLAIVFRDHRLSDLIGFSYAGMEPQNAAQDLIGHLEAITRQLKQRQGDDRTSLEQPWLVTIALDGENCWEYYDRDGLPFLDALYSRLSQHPEIELVTVGDYLDRFPPRETLPVDRLHSGSWVDGSFSTWIGDPAKNRAWDLLTAARETLARHPEATETTNPAAWEALYAAEGSDWFWWFGFGHSSNQDAIFDRLFREHLCAIYQALNEPIPPELLEPVEVHEATGDRTPQNFIHPIIDGCGDDQDWNQAGRIAVGGSRGTMHQSSPIQTIWYGVDHHHFYVRLDFQTGKQPDEIHLCWFYPDRPAHNSPVPLEQLPDLAPANYHYRHHIGLKLPTKTLWFSEAAEFNTWRARPSRARFAVDSCLELAVPWDDLPVEPDWGLRLALFVAHRGEFSEVLPGEDLIQMGVP